MRIMGDPEWSQDPRFSDPLERFQYWDDEIEPRVIEWSRTQNKLDIFHAAVAGDPPGGDRVGQHGRLAVLRRHQVLVGPLEADAREVVPEEVVRLLEGASCSGERIAEGLAHADFLRALSGEQERDQSWASTVRRGHAKDLMPTPRATGCFGWATRENEP